MSTTAELARRAEVAQQIEDLRLSGDVQRGRRLVGDQQCRIVDQRHRDHHALAHAARELVRVSAHSPGGVGDTDLAQHLDRQRPRLGPGACSVQLDRLEQLRADRHQRVQRGQRVLEDQRDLTPRIESSSLSEQLEQLGAVEHGRPVTVVRRGGSSPTSDRQLTDLPEPDSPTMPRTVPRSTDQLTWSTAWITPSSVLDLHRQIPDRQQRGAVRRPAAGSDPSGS